MVVAIALATAVAPLPTDAATVVAVAESSGCELPRFYPPRTGTSGYLSSSLPVRGPAGALFGRTIGEIRDDLVWWTVPMSDGARVQVHRLLLPALSQVEANLAEAAAKGLHYQVRSAYTSAYSPRTSVAHDGISYHGFGAAIDINSIWNPYRADDKLITDMPAWFVEAWESAGMCWGGHWKSVKDPMHFSWVGPAGTPGYRPPAPVEPRTSPTSFVVGQSSNRPVVFGPNGGEFIADVSGDGAPDVVQVRSWGDDAVLEAATSRGNFEACSIWRWWIEDPPPGTPHLADISGSSRPDLLYLDDTSGSLVVTPYVAAQGYERGPDLVTGVAAGGRSVLFGDFDGDGADDLWTVDPSGGGLEIAVWGAAAGFTEEIGHGIVADLGTGRALATADRDIDGRADLMVVGAASPTTISVVSAADLNRIDEVVAGPSLAVDALVGFEDFDGDGRPDLQALTGGGRLELWSGNTTLGGVAVDSWFLPADFECGPDTLPYFFDGRFADDEDSVFQADIDWLATTGITRGCNPPFEDRFCPDDVVTRGQMAAFLNRALGLDAAEGSFVDDDGSVFEADIGALAAAGITRGCNPPANDRFCPDDVVTRGQMAAFLHRAGDRLVE